MNVLIITSVSFPYGMAPTNRVISYSKGFLENKIDVFVGCFKPTEKNNNSLNNQSEGVFEEIPYRYLPGSPFYAGDFIGRRLQDLRSVKNMISLVFSQNKKKRVDSVIMYANFNVFFHFILAFTCKVLNIPLLTERSEFPYLKTKNNLLGKLLSKLYFNFFFKIYDGFLVETETLEKYFRNISKKKAKFLLIPATANPTDIIGIEHKKLIEGDYIAYSGGINEAKRDGLDILIKAFLKVKNQLPPLKLVITGPVFDKKFFEKLKEIIREFNGEDYVIFTGELSRKALINYLANAKLLAGIKEPDLLTTGGLSSKIIEYLFTGIPVVTTEVNEIVKYLENKKNVFFTKPEVENLSEVLIEIFNNYQFAKKIGENGREIALDVFYYKNRVKDLIKFIGEFK